MDQVEGFLEMSRQEQMLRLGGTILSLDDFLLYRPSASAVHITIAMNE